MIAYKTFEEEKKKMQKLQNSDLNGVPWLLGLNHFGTDAPKTKRDKHEFRFPLGLRASINIQLANNHGSAHKVRGVRELRESAVAGEYCPCLVVLNPSRPRH